MIKNWIWDLPATTAVWSNNQIGKYIDRKWATILKDVFSATANWFWKVFFQPNEFTVLQDNYAFTFKKPVKNIKRLQMYFVSILNKIYSKYSWENKSWWNKIKEEVITLPILVDWEIAYDYMENYIKEIEAYHIKEIEAYLQSTGLSDYELNKDEIESLRIISESKGKKFTLDELFEKLDLKFLKEEFNKEKDISKEQTQEFNIPLVNAKFWNNGIMYYWREQDFETAELTLDIVNDWAISTGMVYPQIQKTWVLYNAYLIKPKFKHNRNLLLYFAWVVQKSIQARFSYENKAWWNKVKDEEIVLPLNTNNEIDFHLIETYIKATQKLVIKDLVDNINEKLKTYKEII